MKKGVTLAECATHIAISKKKFSFGFTLAEVLITLGIIGVVAAITMPMLIANYQKTVIVSQLKKSYSMWEQAFQKILADEGVDKLSDTEMWSSCNPERCDENFLLGLSKYIKFEFLPPDSVGFRFMQTSDGVLINGFDFYETATTKDTATCTKIKELGGSMCSFIGDLSIDVNGKKGPGRWGRDEFGFNISDEGKLYPWAGKDVALYNKQVALSSNTVYWKNSSYMGCDPTRKTPGEGCAARIMENGWKMDY